jgi:hypothetical protein
MPPKMLGKRSYLDKTARVIDSERGCWTEVGARRVIIEALFYISNGIIIIHLFNANIFPENSWQFFNR